MADTEALNRAMAELPTGQRRAVELLRLKEMSLKEASTAAACRSLHSRFPCIGR